MSRVIAEFGISLEGCIAGPVDELLVQVAPLHATRLRFDVVRG